MPQRSFDFQNICTEIVARAAYVNMPMIKNIMLFAKVYLDGRSPPAPDKGACITGCPLDLAGSRMWNRSLEGYVENMKNLNIILKPTDIQFTEKWVELVDFHTERHLLPYKDIVQAGLRVYNQESEEWYEPEITEITKGMEGDLVVCDNQNCQWIIHTDLMEKTAQAVLSELVMHAPYILVGRQTWVDLGDEDSFAEISDMVDLMRQC